MIPLLETESEEKYLSNLKDPFNANSVYKIEIEIARPIFKKDVTCIATIRFKNGDTRGSHKIENPNFIELVKELEKFTESLKT